jgi:hypothetical protein
VLNQKYITQKSESLSKHGQLFQVRHKNMNDSLEFVGEKTVHVIQQKFYCIFLKLAEGGMCLRYPTKDQNEVCKG